MIQKTLIIFKPDCMEKNLMGTVLARFEKAGLTLAACRMLRIDDALVRSHYAHLVNEPYFDFLSNWMKSRPVVAAVLKGEKNPAKIFRAEIRLDFVQFSRLPESGAKDARSEYRILKDEENAAAVGEIIVATLPAEYISDIRVRIDAFRRLATAGTPDEVRAVAESMEDRFGKLPPEARAFCAVAELRCVAEAHGIIELETEAGAIRARRRSGDYVRVGANFPRLSSLDPFRRLRELRDFLLRQ